MSFKPLTSWSFSRYSKYTSCPAQFKFNVLMKLPEPKSEALDRGAKVHDDITAFLKGLVRATPKDLKKFEDLARDIKLKAKKTPDKVIIEEDWALRVDWTKTRWDDWIGCWLRAKVDAAYFVTNDELAVVDWKTGKYRPDRNQEYLEQLELYAAIALTLFSDIKDLKVSPRLVYLDTGDVHPAPKIYTSVDMKPLQKTWEKRVAPMFKDKTFKPKPGNACRWCHYRKSNGGPCEY